MRLPIQAQPILRSANLGMLHPKGIGPSNWECESKCPPNNYYCRIKCIVDQFSHLRGISGTEPID